MKSLGRYLKHHSWGLTASGLAGIAFGLIFVPWVLKLSWFRLALLSEESVVLTGISLAILLALLHNTKRTVEYWRRYRRTLSLEMPPLLPVDCLTVALFFSAVTTTYLFWMSVIPPPAVSLEIDFFFAAMASVILIWIIGSFLWSYWPQAAGESGKRDPSTLDYPDEPITDDSQDLLGRVEFVDRLYAEIVQLPFPDSFVFGLHGGWGEGKTSVLNLLQRRLARNPSMITVTFNPWYLATEAALIQSFYNSIDQAIRRRFIVPGLRSMLRRYQNLLTFGLSALGFTMRSSIRDNPEQLRFDLQSLVSRIGLRVILVIDDIDRLQRQEILAVFKLAKLATRLEQTVFLLSFDHEVIRRRLNETSATDPDFLEKIVQKPLRLPLAEQRDIDRFLFFSDERARPPHRSAIDLLLDEIKVEPTRRRQFDEKVVYFYRTHLRQLFRTIRKAKRFLNGLRATLPPIAKEVDLYDFFLLEAVRLFFPAVYQDIGMNPWYYIPTWTMTASLISPFGPLADESEKYRRIQTHIEGLLVNEPMKDIVRPILEEIFFVELKNALSPTRRVNHDNSAGAYRAEKRLTHPDCFPKYFLYRIPAGELADHVVEDLIVDWNGTPITEVENSIAAVLRRYREAEQILQLLDKLNVFMRGLKADLVRPVVRSVCRVVPDLSRSGTEPWYTEYDQAEVFILRLLENQADEAEIVSLLEEVVRDVESLHFAVMFVASCHPSPQGSYFRIYDRADVSVLRRLASERLYIHYIQEARDIFQEMSESDWGYVLYQWGTNWSADDGENRVVVQQYVMGFIEHRPEYLGRILRRLVTKSFPSGAITFHFDNLRQLYNPADILDLLDRYGDRAIVSPEEREAAEMFRDFHSRHEGGGTQGESPEETM